jgi:RNA polymerase sigma factor (TIGR02999 family)
VTRPDGEQHSERRAEPSGPGVDGTSSAALLELLYVELRRLAQSRLAHERSDHTLQATALVHEVFLRIASDRPAGWQSKAQFFSAAAEAMRRILIEHARKHGRHRRGGGRERLSLNVLDLAVEVNLDDVLALDEAIGRLRAEDARAAQIVDLRYFAGLTVEETANALGLSERTVRREWAFARAWLYEVFKAEP